MLKLHTTVKEGDLTLYPSSKYDATTQKLLARMAEALNPTKPLN